MKMKTKRICAGLYEYSAGGRIVFVEQHSFGWVARANWDAHLYTDPCETKREAVRNVEDMLLDS